MLIPELGLQSNAAIVVVVFRGSIDLHTFGTVLSPNESER